jgi:geranylgeranyl pyrophosphate synthase
MAAQIQREVAERVLLKLDAPAECVVRLVAVVTNIFYEGYLGQLIDSRMRVLCPIANYIGRCEQIAGHFHGGLARMAAIFAAAPEELVEKVGRIGFSQGIALQIRNDLVDCIPSSILAAAGAAALERTPFEDVRNGKWTMPLLYAYERAGAENRERLESWMRGGGFSDELLARLTKMLLDTCAYEMTLQQVTNHKEMAQRLLLEFPTSPAREALSILLETVENSRSYVQVLAARPP